MNKNIIIIVSLILIILIILFLINNNFKETFICINPTKIETDKICDSSFKMINNKNFLNNNTTNGYIKINYKDKFGSDGTLYYKCVDNWDGTLKDFNKVQPKELNKNQFYDKLKQDNPEYNFNNLELYKCNKTCPFGKGIKDNSNICKDCDIDEYNMGDSYKCKKYNNNCPEFGYLKSTDKKTGIINCNPCYPGTYSDIENANNCKLSKPGYYVNKYGQSIEKPCELGTYSNTLSSKSCTPAEKGYYIDLTGQTTAKPCEFGTYSNTLGSKSCTPAEKGYYIDLTGQTTAKPCELGTYSNTIGNITCSPAEKGYYIDDIGQITAKPCSIDKTTNAYGSKSINSCVPILRANTQWIYDIPGIYQWTCPSGVKKISVVAVGGGGGGGCGNEWGSSGGGGGGLIWVNNINVKQDSVYTIEVGAGGLGGQTPTNLSINGQNGGDTIFIDDSNNQQLFIAKGGIGGIGGQESSEGGEGGDIFINIDGTPYYHGGKGGKGGKNNGSYCGGGGGAGGYVGEGGDGANGIRTYSGNHYVGRSGETSGLSGGGGGAIFDTSGNAAPGGGVGIYGRGNNGKGGDGDGNSTNMAGSETRPKIFWEATGAQGAANGFVLAAGKSGSDGIDPINDFSIIWNGGGKGGNSTAGEYGGGGGGYIKKQYGYSNGAKGALRIIHNPEALFPSTKVSSSNYDITYYNENKVNNRDIVYHVPGTYEWTCPSDITKISLVMIGGGGSGGIAIQNYDISGGSGGGGGGLLWANNVSVVPGKVYTIMVGAGGLADINGDGYNGGDTKFIDNGNGTELLIANGGKSGDKASMRTRTFSDGSIVYFKGGGAGSDKIINIPGHTDYGGGKGGDGGESNSHSGATPGTGGGAGGYTGKGGNGMSRYTNASSEAGQGGGGGGGGHMQSYEGPGGGGVDIYGEGTSGRGYKDWNPNYSGNPTYHNNYEVTNGQGGSGGENSNNEHGGLYGGGGGGGLLRGDKKTTPGSGANGVLRIIYNKISSFPTTYISKSHYNTNFATRVYPPIRNFRYSTDLSYIGDTTGGSHTKNINYIYGSGNYTITSSSRYNNNKLLNPIECFNDNSRLGGLWKASNYINGTYSGSFNNKNGKLTSIGYVGDWIEIELPVQIKLSKIELKSRDDFDRRAPGDFRIYGSNDEINWEKLIDKSGTNKIVSSDYKNNIYKTTDIENNNNSYKYFILIVNKLVDEDDMLNLHKWYLYGTEVSKSDYNGTKLSGNTQWIYNKPGSYQWTCPPGVNKISVVAVGGGGGGNQQRGSGGGGGGLIWVNNINVVPGNNYTITVGTGGDGKHGQDGGDTKFINNGTESLIAHGGQGGKINDSDIRVEGGIGGQRIINIPGHTNYGGGNGGQGGEDASGGYCGGGGGAGGYRGNGGNGNNINPGNDGIGGGGGGGVVFDGTGNAAPGGGVGIYGQGDNGQGGLVSDGSMSSPYYTYTNQEKYDVAKGKSGSGGIEAVNDPEGSLTLYRWGQWKKFGGNSTAGKYGGGGGGITGTDRGYSNGGNGALRIIYRPDGKGQFPSTKVSNSDYIETHINNILQ
jgi:hypothetical protein